MIPDLILKGGRLVDPAQNIDGKFDLEFRGGKVHAIAPEISGRDGAVVKNVSGCLVVPGLIDMHSHVYWGATSISVDAEMIARRSGTTTFLDAGSAGAGNFLGFKKLIIDASPVRILSYLNISFAGIFGVSKTMNVGECEDLRLLDANECIAVASQHPDTIRGIKFRAGRIAGGNSGMAPMMLAIEVASTLKVPVMAHIDTPPPAVTEVFRALRPGDIFTHCFKPFPSAPVDGGNRIREEVCAARERGVIFDIGHGRAAFTFPMARLMLDQGFKPDVISSDVHVACVDGPAFDVLMTMSKFLTLGLDISDVVRAATAAPAAVLRRPDLGTLKPGSAGDAAILEMRSGDFEYVDARQNKLQGRQKLFVKSIIIGGSVWHEA